MSSYRSRLRRCLVTTVAGALAAATLSTAAAAESATTTPAPTSTSPSEVAPEDPAVDDVADPSGTDASGAADTASDSATPPSPAPAEPTPGTPKPAPQQQAADEAEEDGDSAASSAGPAAAAEDQPSVTAAAAAASHNPEGAMGAWAGGDGLIYFSGYAFDRDDFAATVITMYTLDGAIVGSQPARLRSPELDPYGLPYKGVFGAFQAPSAGQHQLCMFVFNVGGGTDVLASCVNVQVPAKNPRGDIVVDVVGSQIRVNGWLFDESNPAQSLAMWVVDNGQIVSSFVASGPSPYLYPYGVPGNHSFGHQFTPGYSGSHDICVYGINVGFGQNAWVDCDTVSVTVPKVNNDPQGGLTLDIYDVDQNGYLDVFIDAYAFDPNDYNASINIGFFVNGNLVGPFSANQWSGYLAPYGVFGNHGFYEYIGEYETEIEPGTHEVCLYAFNIGPGTSRLIQCESFTV